MLVRFLVIDKPGLNIKIKGLPEIRTPAKIDISSVDVNIVVMELRKYGLEHYQILMEEKVKPKVKQKSKEEEKSVDLTSVYERFDKIDQLMEQIVKNPSEVQTIIRETVSSESPVIEKLGEDEFVPTIDVSNLEISKPSTKTKSMDGDVDEGADLLRGLSKKSGG